MTISGQSLSLVWLLFFMISSLAGQRTFRCWQRTFGGICDVAFVAFDVGGRSDWDFARLPDLR
jgi:hypothetical protein